MNTRCLACNEYSLVLNTVRAFNRDRYAVDLDGAVAFHDNFGRACLDGDFLAGIDCDVLPDGQRIILSHVDLSSLTYGFGLILTDRYLLILIDGFRPVVADFNGLVVAYRFAVVMLGFEGRVL